MRSVCLLALLALSSQPVLAAGNPYEVAGIFKPDEVGAFVTQLKQAVAGGDRQAVAAMIDYPVAVYSPGGAHKTYRSPQAVVAAYPTIFTPEVVEAIKASPTENLFARDQGVMIGQGQVWMGEPHRVMKITSINHTR